MSKQALLVIDPQNDYLSSGAYPLWNSDVTLNNIEQLMKWAQHEFIPVILIQHISTSPKAAFFKQGTFGAQICQDILDLNLHSHIVEKHYADSFDDTKLGSILNSLDIDTLLLCGMMTQNCIAFTALSDLAKTFSVTVVADACTTIDSMIHNIALNGLSRRCDVISVKECIGERH